MFSLRRNECFCARKLDACIDALYAIYVEDGHYLLKNSTQIVEL
mgnify:CR=1 FL=1